jgi:hypothetical protein
MSVARLLISGLLVASGLVLAAFTLHGAFDARQVQASALKPWSTDTLGAKGRRAAPDAQPKATAGTAFKADVTSAGAPTDAKATADAKAAAKARRKQLAEKRAAEKKAADEAKAKQQQPQQTALQWPWNWFK